MKYFVFSIDDGTIFDKDVIDLFNSYHVRATFNLNSGLNNFTWYYEDRIPITRLVLEDNVSLYEGHEVASHTLYHPYLDSCSDEEVVREVNEDVDNIERIFHQEVVSFATPFETCDEREVYLIKNYTKIQNIRLSMIDESFSFPKDPYHIKVTALDIHRSLELLPSFLEREDGLFVYAGHSYDFYVGNTFEKLEELLKIIVKREDIQILTMKEIVSALFK